jgi:DTW domain-containing protein YfiP
MEVPGSVGIGELSFKQLILCQIGGGFKPLNGEFQISRFGGDRSGKSVHYNLPAHSAEHRTAQLPAVAGAARVAINPGDRPCYSSGMASAEPIDNRVFVLILQHPQEKKEVLATAALTCALLSHTKLVVGLSWPNLSRALSRSVNPKRWAVLYLGSARPASFEDQREVIALDRRGEPAPDQEAILRGMDGVVVLDGTWKEAKTLWWRNPWLLKMRRLVLNPPHKSRYGRIRREPRREALSTLEAVAMLLKHLDGGPEIETTLLGALDRLIAEAPPPVSPKGSG